MEKPSMLQLALNMCLGCAAPEVASRGTGSSPPPFNHNSAYTALQLSTQLSIAQY